MRARDAVGRLADLHTEELVVVGLGASMHEWHRAMGAEDASFHMHTMGLGSSFGLGLALAQPERSVWALEGDGGIVLNLGAILTLAAQQPPNLKYFLVWNRLYAIIDGPRWVGADSVDFYGIATAAGISRVHCVRDTSSLEAICATPGFDFVVLDVEPGDDGLAHASYEGAEIKYRFARHVMRTTGRPVLGDHGY